MKLAIGTAQFGMDYGFVSPYKQNTIGESREILKIAQDNGIDHIDTAHSYGNGEEVIGQVSEGSFSIITKTPLNLSSIGVDNILPYLKHSLDKLNVSRAYGLLIHNADDLMGSNRAEVYGYLQEAKSLGLVENIGVSVYDPEQALKIADQFNLDIIQVPCNILDQRFVRSGILESLKRKNIKIYARSVFLQGVLLKHTDDIPLSLDGVKKHIIKLQTYAKDMNMSVLSLLLSYVSSIKAIDRIVVGIHKPFQLNEVIEAYKQLPDLNMSFSQFSANDPNVIDPRKWNK